MIQHHPERRLARRRLITALGILAGALASLACERPVSPVPQLDPVAVSAHSDSVRAGVPADSALAFPILPDSIRTPGASLEVTAADICVPGYSKRVRHVPAAVKRQAYANYGILTHQPGEYEVDHLISLELGGSNSIRNLWPESFHTHPWNAYVKDALENELNRRVCAGTMDLAKAQFVIAHNWVAGYRIYVHPNPPSATVRGKTRTRNPRAQPQFQGAVP